jgi:hypothetical protein
MIAQAFDPTVATTHRGGDDIASTSDSLASGDVSPAPAAIACAMQSPPLAVSAMRAAEGVVGVSPGWGCSAG